MIDFKNKPEAIITGFAETHPFIPLFTTVRDSLASLNISLTPWARRLTIVGTSQKPWKNTAMYDMRIYIILKDSYRYIGVVAERKEVPWKKRFNPPVPRREIRYQIGIAKNHVVIEASEDTTGEEGLKISGTWAENGAERLWHLGDDDLGELQCLAMEIADKLEHFKKEEDL